MVWFRYRRSRERRTAATGRSARVRPWPASDQTIARTRFEMNILSADRLVHAEAVCGHAIRTERRAVYEEAYEHGKSPESQKKAQEGRDLRNEGRIEDEKPPKTTKPGTGH